MFQKARGKKVKAQKRATKRIASPAKRGASRPWRRKLQIRKTLGNGQYAVVTRLALSKFVWLRPALRGTLLEPACGDLRQARATEFYPCLRLLRQVGAHAPPGQRPCPTPGG
jgi:hypothetical protein